MLPSKCLHCKLYLLRETFISSALLLPLSIGNVFASDSLLVCPHVREKDYAKSFQVIFMKLSRIMDNCYGKNRLNLWINPTEKGQLSAILFFYYNILHMGDMQFAYMIHRLVYVDENQ